MKQMTSEMIVEVALTMLAERSLAGDEDPTVGAYEVYTRIKKSGRHPFLGDLVKALDASLRKENVPPTDTLPSYSRYHLPNSQENAQ